MINDPYQQIILTNKPDKDLEIFWYELKKMVTNSFKDNIPINIEELSQKLNKLQQNQEYTQIEADIHKYIGFFCKIYVKYQCSKYECNLLNTQIKRWNNISKKYPIFTSDDIRIQSESCCIFYIYLKYLDYNKCNEMDRFFCQLAIESEYNKEYLINISIKNNYPYFLDKINNCVNVAEIVNAKYHTKIHKNTSGKKIIASLEKNPKI
jgi:hypothetical protein